MKIIDQQHGIDVTDQMLTLIYGDAQPAIPDDAFYCELNVIAGRPETDFSEGLVRDINRIPDDMTLMSAEFGITVNNSDYWSDLRTLVFKDENIASNPVGVLTDLITSLIYDGNDLFSASLVLDRSISNSQMDHDRIREIIIEMAELASEQVRWENEKE